MHCTALRPIGVYGSIHVPQHLQPSRSFPRHPHQSNQPLDAIISWLDTASRVAAARFDLHPDVPMPDCIGGIGQWIAPETELVYVYLRHDSLALAMELNACRSAATVATFRTHGHGFCRD
jgi:hypothetical protein